MKSIACLSLLIVVSACGGGPDHPQFIAPPVQTAHAGSAGEAPFETAGAAGSASSAGDAGEDAEAGAPAQGGAQNSAGTTSAGSAGKINVAGAGGQAVGGSSNGTAGTAPIVGGQGGNPTAGTGGTSAGAPGIAGSPAAGSGGTTPVDTCEQSDREGTFTVAYTYHPEQSTCASEPMFSFKSVLSVVKPQPSTGCMLVGSHVQDECSLSIAYKCMAMSDTFVIDVLSHEDNVDGSKFSGTVTVQDGCVAVYSFTATK